MSIKNSRDQPHKRSLVLFVNPTKAQSWLSELTKHLPDFNCQHWTEVQQPDDIEFAVAWSPPIGELARYKNLQCVVSIGAGIDHIIADPLLPQHLPIIRTTGIDLTQRMLEYVCLHVLAHHRQLQHSIVAQHAKQWAPVITPTANEVTVGIMGLGTLGRAAATMLHQLGFKVNGWANSKHRIDNVTCYSQAELKQFLSTSNILVCLLPLTDDTRNILNKAFFAQLPNGATIINVGRGEHLNEADLLNALRTGQISHATLDVFKKEPLPTDHTFWSHPQITITPHIASVVDPQSGGREIANNLLAFIAGEPLDDLTNRDRGY